MSVYGVLNFFLFEVWLDKIHTYRQACSCYEWLCVSSNYCSVRTLHHKHHIHLIFPPCEISNVFSDQRSPDWHTCSSDTGKASHLYVFACVFSTCWILHSCSHKYYTCEVFHVNEYIENVCISLHLMRNLPHNSRI